MNQPQTIDSGKGLLKEAYPDNGVSAALKRKREKLAEGRGIEVKKDDEEKQDE